MSAATLHSYTLRDSDLITHTNNHSYVLRVKDLPESEKPREKLDVLGPSELRVAELLALIWGVGTRKEDVLAMAQRTLKEYGEKSIGSELDARRLAETADIPQYKAVQVVAAFELGRRYFATAAGKPVHIRNAKQAYQHLKAMGYSQKEQLRGLYLNSRYQIIHDEVISVGSLTSNVVHPREVFQPAIERSAVAVIVAHNHPSGSVEPTEADIAVTEQLKAAGTVLGIELLDHLIIAKEKFVSIGEVI